MAIKTVLSKGVVLLASLHVSLTASQGSAGETVSLRLTDGSRLQAELHPRTDHEHLWLRVRSEHATALRAVPWSRVGKALVGGRRLEAAALRQLAAVESQPTLARSPAANEEAVVVPTYAERARSLLGFAARPNADRRAAEPTDSNRASQ